MDDATNGSLKGAKAMNGIDKALNGRAARPRRRVSPQKSGVMSRGFSTIARVATWYIIVTVLLRCPATLDQCDVSSPRVCRPYFQLKAAVSPHLTPYYDTYAAPYVQLVKPYYDTVDRTVLAPTWAYADKYGSPRLAQARTFSQAQWEKTFQPQLARYQAMAKARYDQAVGPYVDRVSTTVGPYYDIAQTSALQTYHELLLPTYQFLEPYGIQGYNAAQSFTTSTAIPSAVWAWNKSYLFLEGTIWPQVRIVYVETVEPQLVKIGQRLGRYNGNGTQKLASDAASSISSTASSSFTKPTLSVSSPTTPSPSTSSAVPSSSASAPPSESTAQVDTEQVRARPAEPVPGPHEPEEGEDETRRVARETVAEDLQAWQDKYAKAADEGADEIEKRVEEISKRMVRRQARTYGKRLVEQLQSTVVSELIQLRRDILNIVGAAAKGSATAKMAEDQVAVVVRRAGMEIKQRAQDVRDWRQQYSAELQTAVTEAAAEHFKILGSIRDLALQKIGMKWAWMEGITYRDWAKYHLLRDRFDEWEKDLEKLIVTHPGLQEAEDAGQAIEDEGMDIARSAAKELGRLKEVAGWKIAAVDATDEFDSDLMKAAAESAGNRAAGETVDADGSAGTALDQSSETASPTESPTMESLAEEATVDGDSEAAPEPSETTPLPTLESVLSQVASAASGAAEKLAAAVEPPAVSSESPLSSATNSAEYDETEIHEELASEAAPVIFADGPAVVENATTSTPREEVEEVEDAAPPPVSPVSSVKPALFGAAAESVPSRKPILDSDSESEPLIDWAKVEAIASERLEQGRAWAEAQYTSAKVAIGLASAEPTPTTPVEKLMANARFNYYAGVGMAHARYSEFVAAASSALSSLTATPTPTDFAGTVSSVASVASESASSMASVAAENVSSAASAASASASSAAAALGENVSSAAAAGYENAASVVGAAGGAVVENWEAVVSRISSQVYGEPTPTPWYESVAIAAGQYASSASDAVGDGASTITSAAGAYAATASEEAERRYSAVSSLVSELLYGKEPSFSESVYSRLSAAYSTATASAASFASAASESAAAAASAAAHAVKDAGESAASVVSQATDAAREKAQHVMDEL